MLKPAARRIVCALVSFGLVLTLGGCKAASPPGEGSTTEPPPVHVPSSTAFDLTVLAGSWSITTVLKSIDNEAMRPAADQPGAEWSCSVEGATMTLITGEHTYEGELVAQGTNGWTYDATAQYQDSEGTTWISAILVSATQAGDDSFSGTMQGEITSSTEGSLYAAEWDITGTRK